MPPFQKIMDEELPKFLKRTVHLAWVRPGAHWMLESILNKEQVIVQAWINGKRLLAKRADLRKIHADTHHVPSNYSNETRKGTDA